MKIVTGIMVVAMAASAAAQSASTVQNVKNQLSASKPAPAAAPAAKPMAVVRTTAAPKAAPAAKPVAAVKNTVAPKVAPVPKPAPSTAAKTAPAPKPAKAEKAVPKNSTPAAKKEAASPSTAEAKKKIASAEGRRDPFLSPVVERMTGPSDCSSGKKCLSADQISLRGIVRSNSGPNIAVVVTSDSRAYFLRENDPIHNGVVVKINENSVIFREQIKDVLGKPATREVVKKINTPA
jgi:hypothetical protein